MKIRVNINLLVFMMTGILLLICAHTHAQERAYRAYATQLQYEKMLKEDPNFKQARADIETFVQQYIQSSSPANHNIPVVFHVLYNDTKDMFSETIMEEQLDIMNYFFGNRGGNEPIIKTKGIKGEDFRTKNMKIDFCIATQDPQGNRTRGIIYKQTENKLWTASDSMKSARLGGSDPWDPERYLNIWICPLKSYSGFAQMPGGKIETDGIVIDPKYFGLGDHTTYPYVQGKTILHLLGNYFNLYPLWGFEPCQGDQVDDTPTSNAPNFTCPIEIELHNSTCYDKPTTEMTMNFMDNTDDPCLSMFTAGQQLRVHASLAEGGPRAKLSAKNQMCNDNTKSWIIGNTPNPSESVNQNSNLGTGGTFFDIRMNVYPNPARQMVNYEIEATDNRQAEIRVLNASGAVQYRQKLELNRGVQQVQVDATEWPGGVYLFGLFYDDQVLTKRILLISEN
ncbi:MAG: zinc-dependent metalloprotease [Bacteroidota bacterium]